MSVAAGIQRDVLQAQALLEDQRHALQALLSDVDTIIGERVLIAETLAAFYRAPLSMSSVQPILDLAVRLNPALRDGKILS